MSQNNAKDLPAATTESGSAELPAAVSHTQATRSPAAQLNESTGQTKFKEDVAAHVVSASNGLFIESSNQLFPDYSYR